MTEVKMLCGSFFEITYQAPLSVILRVTPVCDLWKIALNRRNEEEHFPLHNPSNHYISEVRTIMTARQDLLFLLYHRVIPGKEFQGVFIGAFCFPRTVS